MGRLEVYHFLAEEAEDIDLFNGMLDRAKCEEILTHLIEPEDVAGFFVCGPGPMMDAAEEALLEHGDHKNKIPIERITSDRPSAADQAQIPATHAQARGPTIPALPYCRKSPGGAGAHR